MKYDLYFNIVIENKNIFRNGDNGARKFFKEVLPNKIFQFKHDDIKINEIYGDTNIDNSLYEYRMDCVFPNIK